MASNMPQKIHGTITAITEITAITITAVINLLDKIKLNIKLTF